MRLTTVLLIASLMQVSATGLAQKITLNKSRATLKSVLKDIRTQSGYLFLYREDQIKTAKPVDINVKNADFKEVLDKVFANQPFTYTLNEKTIMIEAMEKPSLIDNIIARFQEIEVKGRVVDENGQAIPGVTIRVKDGKGGTISSANGDFWLKSVSEGATIVFSFIGYDAREVAAKAILGDVEMKVSTSKLDEVRVRAYSNTSERLSTGNSSGITSKDIEKQPVSNPLLALQGRVPGIEIYQSSGLPGSGITIRIQGLNSIQNGYTPYYIVDGIPYAQSILPTTNEIRGNAENRKTAFEGFGNPLSYLNPSDIESIEVLKDADATAIYGSRAAGGAVIITTKKGAAGTSKISFNLQNGYGSIPKFVNVMNTEQYLEMRRIAKASDAAAISSSDFDLRGKYGWSLTRNTDWQKELVGETAKFQTANASISGGNNNTRYYVSGSWRKETTVYQGDYGAENGSVHFNLNNTSADKRFNFDLSGTYSADNSNLPLSDLWNTSLMLPPNAPVLRNSDGTLNWAPDENGNTTFYNPLAVNNNTSVLQVNNLTSSASLRYEVLKDLNLKVRAGYNNMQQREKYQIKMGFWAPENRPLLGDFARESTLSTGNTSVWLIEPQLTYQLQLAGGIFQALAGLSWSENTINQLISKGSGFSNDQLMGDLSAASTRQSNSFSIPYRTQAVFGQLNYNWKDKYILNFTARNDASSRFGPENRSHVFASAGATWIFTNEAFIKEKLNWLSFGKLKLSYGTTGNDQIPNYNYLSLYGAQANTPVPYQGIKGLESGGLANPYIQWEETRKLNLGLNLGFLLDRIALAGNYFRNRSGNQLISYPLPQTTGFLDILQNWPAVVQNQGLELSLNTRNITGEKFSWESSVNFTRQRNKLVSFPGLERSSYSNNLAIGYPVNIVKGFHYIGVDSNTGIYTFEDFEGKATSTPQGPRDRYLNLDRNPDFSGGISNTLTHGNFSLDFLFQFSKRKMFAGDIFGFNVFSPGFFNSDAWGNAQGNQMAVVLDNWRQQGDQPEYQKFSTNFSGSYATARRAITNSDKALVDASYIQLKNISLSYSLPKTLANKLHFQDIRIFSQAQNLFSLNKFPFANPEASTVISMPPLRVFTFGISASL